MYRDLLLSQVQPSHDTAIPPNIAFFEVVEQAAPLTDELEQSSARVVVLLVDLEMLGQVADSVAEQSNLDLRRPRVRTVYPEPGDQVRFGTRQNALRPFSSEVP